MLKTGARFFISFLASVFLVCFLILFTFKITLFDDKYIEKQAVKTDYYQQLTNEINQQIENSLLGSNIPKGITSQVVTEKEVKEDVNNYFQAIYNKKEGYEISNTSTIHNNASNLIKKYIEENNIETVEDIDQTVNNISNQVTSIYTGYIDLPFLVSYGQKMLNYESTLFLFMVVCILIFLAMSIALYTSLKGYIHRLMRHWSYIFAGSGLMLILFPAYVIYKGIFDKLAIQSKAMYDFIHAYLSNFLWLFIYLGGIAFVLGLLFIVLSETRRKILFSK